MNDMKFMIIEDDKQIRLYLETLLRNEKILFDSFSDAKTALYNLKRDCYELILLDLGLPDCDGLELIKEIRLIYDTPIIVVSARYFDEDKIKALDLGANDYLVKPFSGNELLARIRVIKRYMLKDKQDDIKDITIKNLKLDFDKRLVYLNNQLIHLTPLEYQLLCLFVNNLDKVLSSNYIIKMIWKTDYINETTSLRKLIASLRRKIEIDHCNPEYIVTEIGVGYRFKTY